ncbi:MAG: polysaccharide deacetylase family protein [Rhizobiaceae bacterium]|nr:polysaccharide deacetylase family protein [Rhizobiaceae bacterium]MCV0405276.1 polysaccharide deacetylase family protein [Rhizobiaceae bacterium]
MIDKTVAARKLALTALRYSGLASLARHAVTRLGAIMMLHRVTSERVSPLGVNSHLTISPDFLDALLTEMRRLGYAFLSMDELMEHLSRGARGGLVAAFTADDGYRDNAEEALPVLEAHDAPLAIYVAPGLVDGAADLWWDVLETIIAKSDRIDFETGDGPRTIDATTPAQKRAANARLHDYLTRQVPEREQVSVLRRMANAACVDPQEPARTTLLDWSGIAALAERPSVTIGAHTVHHVNLKRLESQAALEEMVRSATLIEARTGRRPLHFAYPYGSPAAVGPREVGLAAEAGFTSAVTTRHGLLRPDHAAHPHALPRISVNGLYQEIGYMRTLLSGITTPMANAGRLTVTV